MKHVLEDLYLHRFEFIEDHLLETHAYSEALKAHEDALKIIAESLPEQKQGMMIDLYDTEAALRDHACAGAFACGYRFRVMMSSAMLE